MKTAAIYADEQFLVGVFATEPVGSVDERRQLGAHRARASA
jgi:hypothetical protein